MKSSSSTLFVGVQIKKVVYKNRIRLKEFLVDFDKVRHGTIPKEGLSSQTLPWALTPLGQNSQHKLCVTHS